MKKILMGAALMAIVATGCQNEELVQQRPADGIKLTATIGGDSRTIVDEDGYVNWVEGDAFLAWGTGNALAEFTLQNGEGTTTGDFTGSMQTGFFKNLSEMVYPSSMVNKSGGNVTVTLDEVTFDNSSAPMYGVVNPTAGTVTCQHLAAMLRVTIQNLPEGENTLEVKGTGIAGKATLSDGELTNYPTTEQTVTVTGIPSGRQTIDIPVYATGENMNLTFSVNNGEGYVVENLDLEVGKMYQSVIPLLGYTANGLVLAWDGTVDTNWYDATATEFTINTPAELAGLAQLVNNGTDNFKDNTVKLGASMDMSGIDFGPIGTYTNGVAKPFYGTFDGQNHTISNLYVKDYNAALFGRTTGATIKNLTIDNSTFVAETSSEGKAFGACLVAYVKNNLTVENVKATNSVATVKGETYYNLLIGQGKDEAKVNGVAYVYVSSQADLDKVDSDAYIELAAGEYNVGSNCKNRTLTISGNADAVLTVVGAGQGEADGQLDYDFEYSTVTFNGITIKTNNQTYAGYARLNGTFNYCVFENGYCLNGEDEFNYCTFNVSGDQYNVWTWGSLKVEFNYCTFNSDGKALLVYHDAGKYNDHYEITVNNCTFYDKGGLTDLKAAIEIGAYREKTYKLIVNNTTVYGYEINDKGINTGTTLWGNKNSLSQERLDVVVDGVDEY